LAVSEIPPAVSAASSQGGKRPIIIVSDTSPINYLLLCGALWVLPKLYGVIIIPQAVRAELITSILCELTQIKRHRGSETEAGRGLPLLRRAAQESGRPGCSCARWRHLLSTTRHPSFHAPTNSPSKGKQAWRALPWAGKAFHWSGAP
jgi:hypothetical protein